jgi:hypothetical protein
MILEPAGDKDVPKAVGPAATDKKSDASDAPGAGGGNVLAAPGDASAKGDAAKHQAADAGLSEVKIDEQKIKALKQRWEQIVAPKNKALREAAQAHYEVINALRKEQNRLIDEADRVQRVIEELQKDYQDMTTPRPGGEGQKGEKGDADPLGGQ